MHYALFLLELYRPPSAVTRQVGMEPTIQHARSNLCVNFQFCKVHLLRLARIYMLVEYRTALKWRMPLVSVDG